ncbi:MAG: Aerobic-type carbon monoxide dehydrogenase, small subunit CoxS/CutS homologs, partial [uncultured Craurococcus sp.]
GGGRGAGALLHSACGGLRGGCHPHHRGLRSGCGDGGAARGLLRRACAAMRLLHAGDAGDGTGHRSAAARGGRGAGAGGAGRESLPLHRLSRHRPGDPRRAGGAKGYL